MMGFAARRRRRKWGALATAAQPILRWPGPRISPYKTQNAAEMSTLANRPFVKMNGLGNEIVVVDMRPQGGTISAAEARAVAQADGVGL